MTTLRQVVQDVFYDTSKQYEGEVPWMYLDCKGLVTTGVGNLINTTGEACKLPFVHADGSPATQGEIASEWMLVHSHQELAKQGFHAAKGFCRLHLTDEGIASLVHEKLLANWSFMCAKYPCFKDAASWPAAAQLAASLMAWAVGAGFPGIFKNWAVQAGQQNWNNCSKPELCYINAKGNPGVIPRNKAVEALFLLAAIQPQSDYDQLHVGDIEGAP